MKSPYEFAKKFFTEARSGTLTCSKEELDNHIKEVYSDVKRDKDLPEIKGLKYLCMKYK